jgi:hypothetical protein
VGTTTGRAIAAIRRVSLAIAAALMVLAGNVAPIVGQVESTPVPTEVEAASVGEADASANLSASPDSPPVLAQGLIYLSGADVVWQVREVTLPSPTVAGPETGNARFTYQVSGESVIRNDVTGKRALLELGEVSFMSAGDPYTSMSADGAQSTVWVFEIANDDQVGEGAFYLSPDISGVAEGVYDFEFVHGTLDAGDSTGFTATGGPFLLMVESGQVTVNDESGTAALGSGEGRIVEGNATIDADGDGPATYAVASIGAEVSDASAGAPMALAPVGQEAASTGQQADPSGQQTTTAPQNTDPAIPGINPADIFSGIFAEADESAAPVAAATQDGAFVTSITVWATASIGLTVIVDGVTAFDGFLEPGQSTSWLTGSVFEVYTTSGVGTQFTNTCGADPFVMGYEEADAYYVLNASPSSCAPVE